MSSVHQSPTGSYRVKFRHEGKQQSLTFADQKSAEKWKLQLDARGYIDAMKLLSDEQESELTLVAHCHSYLAHMTGVTSGTKKTYERYLKNHFKEIGALSITAITANTVSAWLNDLVEKGLSGKSIANIHAFLSAALEVAARDEIITKNPSKGLRLPRTHSIKQEMTFLSREEFGELLGEIEEFYRPLVMTLAGTGMRFGEATALTVDDIDFNAKSIRINKAWKMTGTSKRELGKPKTERSNRTVAMPHQVQAVLQGLCVGKKRTTLIFTNKHGNSLAHNVFHPAWQGAVATFEAKTGKHPRIHDLRHTFASWAISANNSLPAIQRTLGHESITTTIDRYGHLARADFDALADSTATFLPNNPLAIEV